MFPVDGDGACGPRTFASWIFQDPTLGPYLARNINQHFVNYWDGYWKNFFSLPFVRLVGNGKEITRETEEDLLEFLTNSREGAYMWRGDEDFSVISNTYQVTIQIITVRGLQDENPVIRKIEPNPDFSHCSELPPGKVPEMIVLHEHDSHYSLIVPQDSRLALEGGLDYQRSQMEKQKPENNKDIGNSMEKRISELDFQTAYFIGSFTFQN